MSGEESLPLFDWRHYSHELQLYSEDLFLRGQAVLSEAKGLDIAQWSPEKLDMASDAVCKAMQDLEESEKVAGLVFNLRTFGLEGEERARA